MNEDFQDTESIVSENSSEIVSGSSDLEEINSIQDTVDPVIASSGSLPVSESGSVSSGSFVYNYYIFNHDSNSGSVTSDQEPEPVVQVPSGVDYSPALEHLTDIHMYILLFTILIFVVTIFYRFRMKGGLR